MELLAEGLLQIKKSVNYIQKQIDQDKDVQMCNPIKSSSIPTGYKVLYSPEEKFKITTNQISIICDRDNGYGSTKGYKGSYFTCSEEGDINFEGCQMNKCHIDKHIASRDSISITDKNKEEMTKLIKSISKNTTLCNNLQDINQNCSLGCRFGYEPSNLTKHIKEGGVECGENGKITEKVVLDCKKKICSRSDFDSWIQKQSKKKSNKSDYSNIDISECFKDPMKHSDSCTIKCDHMKGYKKEDKKQFDKHEIVQCIDGKLQKVTKKANTKCILQQYPKLRKEFRCYNQLDDYITNNKKSLLLSKNTCTSNQTDKEFGNCHLLSTSNESQNDKNKIICIKENNKYRLVRDKERCFESNFSNDDECSKGSNSLLKKFTGSNIYCKSHQCKQEECCSK